MAEGSQDFPEGRRVAGDHGSAQFAFQFRHEIDSGEVGTRYEQPIGPVSGSFVPAFCLHSSPGAERLPD